VLENIKKHIIFLNWVDLIFLKKKLVYKIVVSFNM